MNRKANISLLAFLFVASLFIIASPADAATQISSCQTLPTENETYELTAAVTNTGTCFTFTADNITLDCQGFNVTYGTSATGYGINIASVNDITVKNCNIIEGSSSGSHAIYLSSADNTTFYNNSVYAVGNYDYGISATSSPNNNITNNTITTTGYFEMPLRITGTITNNTISFNTITSLYSASPAYGYNYIQGSNHTISFNNITTYGGYSYPLYLYSGDGSEITSNNITTYGYSAYALYVGNGDGSEITSNTITTSNTYAYGMYIASDNGNITSNTITTSGGTAYGIYSYGGNGNNISSNTITTSGGTAYGIYSYSSTSNTIKDSTVAASSANDIYIVGTGDNYLLNTTFDQSDVGFAGGATGTIAVQWYLDIYVNDTLGRPVNTANTTFYNTSGTQVSSLLTNATGNITQQTLTEYVQDISTTTYATNYTINVSKNRYLKTPAPQTQEINLTGSTATYATLSIVDAYHVRTYLTSNESRSFFGTGETVRIKANTSNPTGFTPKITIRYPNSTTLINYADMTEESTDYYYYDYDTAGNNVTGYYDVDITLDSDNVTKPFNSTFYIGNVWLDEFNNITYLFRIQANISEPGLMDRFFEPVDTHVIFNDSAYNNSIRVVLFNGTNYTEIPSQIYNTTETSGSVSEANVVWLASIDKNANRTYYIAWRGSSVSSNYSSDINVTNTNTTYQFTNTFYNLTFSSTYGGLLQDAINKFGSNTSLQGLTPMEYYPEASISLPPPTTYTVRGDTTPTITVTQGPVFIDYNVSGYLTGNTLYPYTMLLRFFARNPFYTQELNITPQQSNSWINYFDEYIAWQDGIFSQAYWENSTGNISSQSLSTGNNQDSNNLDAGMRWLAAYNNDSGDAFATIFLNSTQAVETSPVIDIYDDTYDFYMRTVIAFSTPVTSGTSFYTKVARAIYDGTLNDTFADNLYDQLNSPLNTSLGSQENFDTEPPQFTDFNVTPQSPTDQNDTTCWSFWTDNIDLNTVIIEENTSGTFQNTTVSLSGTSGYGNLTINATDLNAGTFACRFYGTDTSDNMNLTSYVEFTVQDLTAPMVTNTTTAPNTTALLDPNTTVNITVNTTEYTTTDTVILQYKEWNATNYTNTTMTDSSGNSFIANFTPDTVNNWTYRIYTNDTLGNANTTNETNISIEYDYTWELSTNDLGASSTTLDTNITMGYIEINNTGDFALAFIITSDLSDRIFFNSTSLEIAAKSNATINVTGQADTVERSDSIIITIDSTNSTASPSSSTVNATLVSFSSGPFLLTEITQYNNSVTQGDTGINISAKVTNMGNETATNTSLTWTLPSGWVTSDNLTLNISGNFIVDDYRTHTITVNISSSAPTGEKTLTATSSCCNESNRTKTANVTVIVVGTTTGGSDTGNTIISGGSGPGDGTAGAGGLSKQQKEQLFQTEERFELVRGENNSFIITIENPFDTDFENITINVSGFLASRISLDKTELGALKPNESINVTVHIEAPSYFSQGANELSFTISGFITTKKITTQITEERNIILIIHEIPKEEALKYQSSTLSMLHEMEKLGFHIERMRSIASQIGTKLEEGDYLAVKELNELAQSIHDTSISVDQSINRAEEGIASAADDGLAVPQTIRLNNLAKAAFERGDFFLAKSIAEEAEFTLALETKGEFNYINFIIKNWQSIAIAVGIIILLTLGIFYKTKLSFINRELKNLKKEEGIVIGLIKETQKETFERAKMSMDEYVEAIRQYEKKLGNAVNRRIELESLKANLFRFSKFRAMQEERKKLLELMKTTQKQYMEFKTIETHVYNQRMDSLRRRLTEVEEKLATIEAQKAIKKEMKITRRQL